jgi:hypothetical protein
MSTNAFLTNCTLAGNWATNGSGAYGGTLYHCSLSNNFAPGGGGGAFGATLYSCALTGNAAESGAGAAQCTLFNCTLSDNSATTGGGADSSILYNCTLTGNSAGYSGGGVSGGDYYYPSTLYNCIVLSNSAASGSNYNSGCDLNYCCTIPLPVGGAGNITNDPAFIDPSAGNLRLQPSSPCINAGNNAYVGTPTDLDGNPRIVNGTVDIGAYEFQGFSGLTGFHDWLAQYGLPTDGSADYVDSDKDGMNNWQEWIAGTNPTNAASVLRLLTPSSAGTNITISWQSSLGIGYFLQRSTNLGLPASFLPLATNLPGQVGTTYFADTNVAAGLHLFYRVGVAN